MASMSFTDSHWCMTHLNLEAIILIQTNPQVWDSCLPRILTVNKKMDGVPHLGFIQASFTPNE
jgi:hypothetical protein